METKVTIKFFQKVRDEEGAVEWTHGEMMVKTIVGLAEDFWNFGTRKTLEMNLGVCSDFYFNFILDVFQESGEHLRAVVTTRSAKELLRLLRRAELCPFRFNLIAQVPVFTPGLALDDFSETQLTSEPEEVVCSETQSETSSDTTNWIEEQVEDLYDLYWCDQCQSWSQHQCVHSNIKLISYKSVCEQCMEVECVCKLLSFNSKFSEPKLVKLSAIESLIRTRNINAQSLVQAYSYAFAKFKRVTKKVKQMQDDFVIDSYIKKNKIQSEKFDLNEEDKLFVELFVAIRDNDYQTVQKLLPKLHNEEIAKPQMDEGPQGNIETPSQVTSSNVVIESQRLPSTASTTTIQDFARMSLATEHTDFEMLCNRWYSFANVRWQTVDEPGKVVGEWILPKEPVMQRLKEISNFLPFQTFQYMKGDIEIRVEINANKFQVGQLQLSWMYGDDMDVNFDKLRKNVYNASQRMHCLISAGSSNSAQMYIPFKYPTSYLNIRKNTQYFNQSNLHMGKLTCLVLNQLTTPDSVCTNCTLNFFMKFNNIEFGGMREMQQELGSPQMLGAISSGAKVLAGLANFTSKVIDSNCDKPIAPQPPAVLIPNTFNSLAYTDGVAEQQVAMRAVPLGQTPSLLDQSSLSIPKIAGTYGLVKTIKWSHNDDVGKELLCVPAAPIWDDYESLEKDGSRVNHAPPVACVASMFNLWRGALELRLDVIASSFHTGKLMLVLIAGGEKDKVYSYEALKSCPNMVFDLNENRQCTFKIPYVANKPWWPRGVSIKDSLKIVPPGIVKCFVLNPLIPMDNIASTIDINVYFRGLPGEFEVSIPVAPAFGLSFNAEVKKPDSAYCKTEYVPFFVSYYHYLDDTYATLFRSNVAGQYVTFENLEFGKVYSLSECKIELASESKDAICELFYKTQSGHSSQVNYLVRANRPWQQQVVFLAATYSAAYNYATKGDYRNLIKYYEGGDYCKFKVDGVEQKGVKSAKFKSVTQVSELISQALGEAEVAYPQIEDDVNPPTEILHESITTDFGLKTFGEKIDSFKSLGRRYNNYTEFEIDPKKVTVIPIVYDRPELQLSDDLMYYNDNIYRDGTIPLILSAFRFVRGGLRFKLLFRKTVPKATNIIVMFDPEYCEVTRAVVYEQEKSTPNYPMIIQNTSVNPTVEFEIPYYRAGQYNYLQKPTRITDPNLSEYFSLGAIRIVTTSDTKLEAGLVYSFADDTQVDEFIGFPPMLRLHQAEVARPQIDEVPKFKVNEGASTSHSNWRDKSVNPFRKEKVTMRPGSAGAQPEKSVDKFVSNTYGILNLDMTLPSACSHAITNKVNNTIDNISNKVEDLTDTAQVTLNNAKVVSEKVKQTTDKIEDKTDTLVTTIEKTSSITQTIEKILESLSKGFDWMKSKVTPLFAYLTSVATMLMNPNMQGFSYVVYNLICIIFGSVSEMVTNLTGFSTLAGLLERLWKVYNYYITTMGCFKVFSEIYNSAANKVSKSETAVPQGIEDTPESILTCLVNWFLKVFKMSNRDRKPVSSILFSTFDSAGRLAMSANHISKFITDNLKVFRRVFNYIIGTQEDTAPSLNLFGGEQGKKALKTFINGVTLVCDPANHNKVRNSALWSSIVYRLRRMSVTISVKLAHEANPKLISILSPYMKKIDDLANDLTRHKINSPVGYEPFVLYLYGSSGVGKSSIIDDIIMHLLEQTGVKYEGNPVYTRAPGVSHWDTLCGQPAVKYDDFLQVTSADDNSLSELFQLKTTAEFSPSMANLDDKKTKYNPYIVGICSNNFHIRSNQLQSFDAANRRRDYLMKVEYISKNGTDKMIQDRAYTTQEILDKQHVEFIKYTDPIKIDSTLAAMNYKQMLDDLTLEYQRYTRVQNAIYESKMKKLSKRWASTDSTIASFRLELDALDVDLYGVLEDLDVPKPQMDVISTLSSICPDVCATLGDVSEDDDEIEQIFENAPFPKTSVEMIEELQARTEISKVEKEKQVNPTPDDVLKSCEMPTFEEDSVKVHVNKDNSKFVDICIPGTDLDSLIVDNVNFIDMYWTQDAGVLSASEIGSNSPCCLHNYCVENVFYNEKDDHFYVGALEIPNKVCTYYDKAGDIKELDGCFFKDKDFMHRIRMESQIFTNQKLKKKITVKGLQISTQQTKTDRVVDCVTSTIDKQYKDVEIVDIESNKEDVGFFRKYGIKIAHYLKIALPYVVNIVIREICRYWYLYVGVITVCYYGTGVLTKFFGSKGDIDIDKEVQATIQGSGSKKNYDGGASYRSKQLQKKLKGQFQAKKVKLENFSNTYYNSENYEAQSSLTNTHTASLAAKVFSNTFFVIAQKENGEVVSARCLGIRGHEALIPHHYLEVFLYLEKTDNITYFIRNASGAQFEYNEMPLRSEERIMSESKYTGLTRVFVNKNVGMFKDITKDFIDKETDFPNSCEFLILEDNGKDMIRNCVTLPLTMHEKITVGPGMACTGWTIYDGFKYPYQHKGFCGSVILCELRSRPVIVGMHTAGLEISGYGIAEPILTRFFKNEELVDKPQLREYFTAIDLLGPEVARQQLDTSVTKIGTIPKEFRPRQSRKSKIRPSLIHGVYPKTTEPVPLAPDDPRLDRELGPQGFVNPIFCGSRKRGLVPIPFDSDLIQKCKEDLSAKIIKNCKPIRANVGRLNLKDAIIGIPEIPGYDSIDMSSSEGYPWVLERPDGFNSKKWLFDTQFDENGVENVTGVFQPLVDRIRKTEKMRNDGVVPFTMFQGCLKDERKKISKISTPGKTRVFELSPVDATISHRSLTQDFIAAYTSARFSAEHGIGIDCDSIEWIKLYNLLMKNSDKILVADYSNFGPCLQFECVQAAFDIINDWYSVYQNYGSLQNDNLSREVMAYEIGNSVNICDDLVFQSHCGLPSGCTLTVYLNSLVNCLYMRYVFLSLIKDLDLDYTISDFDKYVRLIVYGDDLILSVKQEILPWFNNKNISIIFSNYDIKYTDATKAEEIRPFCSITDATFLKRGFKLWDLKYLNNRKSKKIVLAPLEKDVVREIANWIHVSENLEFATMETSEASIRMMFGHGCSDYVYHKNKIIKALQEKGLDVPQIPGWNTLAEENFPHDKIPPVFGE